MKNESNLIPLDKHSFLSELLELQRRKSNSGFTILKIINKHYLNIWITVATAQILLNHRPIINFYRKTALYPGKVNLNDPKKAMSSSDFHFSHWHGAVTNVASSCFLNRELLTTAFCYNIYMGILWHIFSLNFE